MPGRLRVLLVEDDASLQRFVAMALEEELLRLQVCTSVDEALLALATQPFDLVITDLMLPGRHGNELLTTLRDRPSLRGQAQLVVFSAGLNAHVRQQLETLGVTRFLSKPCSLADLQTCVRDAVLRRQAEVAGAAQVPASVHQSAIEQYFGGNAALYQAFLARCREQFPQDIAMGRQAAQDGLFQPLRHLAHSLKSVLQTLGHGDAALLARELEDLAQRAHDAPALRDAVALSWEQLEAELVKLL